MAGYHKGKKLDWEINGSNGYCLWMFQKTSKEAYEILESLKRQNSTVKYAIEPLRMI